MKSAVKANISMEALPVLSAPIAILRSKLLKGMGLKNYSSFVVSELCTKLTYLHTKGGINVWLNFLCYLQGSLELYRIKKQMNKAEVYIESC